MNIYNVYTKPGDDHPIENAIFIKEGFSWFAAIFHVFWTFYHKMWWVSGILLALEVVLTFLQIKGYVDIGIIESIKIGVLLLIGANFNDLYIAELERKSYIFQGVISAKNEDEALCKYIANMVQCSTFGSSQGSMAVL